MNKLKRISIFFVLVFFAVGILVAVPGETKKKAYYSGEAINYNGQVYVGTTNTGSFELLALDNGELYKKLTISSYDRESDEFYDCELFEEADRLYVHLVNGRYLYKYDITDPMTPELVKKIKDNSWDWFIRIKRIDGKLSTIGSKQIKIWNDDYQVVNSYDVSDESLKNGDHPGNITFSNNGDYFISAKKGKVSIYDSNNRASVAEFNIAAVDNKRDMVNDAQNSLIYLVDDESLKAIDFQGDVVDEFIHNSHVGYNVVESNDPGYLYFSDGIGVVKVKRSDLEPVDWQYSTNMSNVSGSWSMGIDPVLGNDNEEYLVVFNGSNISILNGDMEVVDDYEAVEEDNGPIEPLFIGLDKHRAPAGSQISVRTGGFIPGEKLEITIDERIASYDIKSNDLGRATAILDVPPTAKAQRTYVKVVGQESGLSYSTSFEIE